MLAVMSGKVIPYRGPRTQTEWNQFLGMVIFLASWAMLFAALFFVYGGLRARAAVWPPVDAPPLPLLWPALNTGVVLLSSYCLHRGIQGMRRGDEARVPGWLGGALVLGIGFVALQALVWWQLYRAGLTPQSGTYGSAFFGLTWVHAAHVIVGLGALVFILVGALRHRYTPARAMGPRLWGMYWHFVGAVWLFLFTTVYVL